MKTKDSKMKLAMDSVCECKNSRIISTNLDNAGKLVGAPRVSKVLYTERGALGIAAAINGNGIHYAYVLSVDEAEKMIARGLANRK